MTTLRGDSSGREALGTPSREPLLWIQLLGLAAWPLEALALLLVLAGGDPGPFPLVERLFCWGLGALVPAVLFWRFPPDLWSLLLVQVPLRGRRERQLRLSALQTSLGLQLLAAAGVLPLLALVWWADRLAGIAWSLSPLAVTPRLLVLVVAAPLLAVMLWQWQQLVQAIWLLSRPGSQLDATLPLSLDQAQGQRLNLGLPLLLLGELPAPAAAPRPPARAAAQAPEASPPQPLQAPRAQPPQPGQAESERSTSPEAQLPIDPIPEPAREQLTTQSPEPPSEPPISENEANSADSAPTDDSAALDPTASPSAPLTPAGNGAAAIPLAIEHQQSPEQGQGSDLDQQV